MWQEPVPDVDETQTVERCLGEELRKAERRIEILTEKLCSADVLLDRALRAICLTRDYVLPKVALPALKGWEWYEAGKAIADSRPDDPWSHEFRERVEKANTKLPKESLAQENECKILDNKTQIEAVIEEMRRHRRNTNDCLAEAALRICRLERKVEALEHPPAPLRIPDLSRELSGFGRGRTDHDGGGGPGLFSEGVSREVGDPHRGVVGEARKGTSDGEGGPTVEGGTD